MTVYDNVPVVTHGQGEPAVIARGSFDSETGEFKAMIKDKSFISIIEDVYKTEGPKEFIMNLAQLGNIRSPEAAKKWTETHQNNPIEELTEALRLTVEYVGTRMLPPIEGWSWYDALSKYAFEKAEELRKDRYLGPDFTAGHLDEQ